jgi:hypothetical protein
MSTTPPFQDPFELLKKMWAPLGLPMPGMVAPLLDANEIDKRIADLKSVENWLGMNLSMLRMTIQGLEMQKSTLAAFQSMHASGTATQQTMADTAAAATAAATRAAEAWWSFLQASQPEPQKPSEPSGKP